MTKKALIAGINTFIPGIPALRGCVNDTIAMQQALKTCFGFEDSNLRLLRDQDATGQGIRDGLDWLIAGSQPGDVLVFHFSSHGTQSPDEGGEEADAQDEVIVTCDHDWNRPFRDDDLRVIFDRIPQGVNFTFIADCCHSGSIQKGLLDAPIEFAPRYVSPPAPILNQIARLQEKREREIDEAVAAQLLEMLETVPPEQRKSRMAALLAAARRRVKENRFQMVSFERHFLLAACQDRQTAADARIDNDFRGAFTWALTGAIAEANGNLTYEQAIARLGDKLRPYEQAPQLECPAGLRSVRLFEPII